MQVNFDKIYGYVIEYGMRLVAAIIIFIVGKWVARLVSNIVAKTMDKGKVNKTLTSFVTNIIYFGIFIFVIIAVLNKIGVETNSFVAIIGAAGLAVGFALQGSLANFAASVMIILFQPFQVGDNIETAGVAGKVVEIQIFNTILITSENKRVIIPNSKVTSDKIIIHQKS